MNQADSNERSRNPTDGTLSADDVRERLWAYEDFAAVKSISLSTWRVSFASLGFIFAAVRRSRRFWLLWGVIGIVAGLGVFVKFPVSYVATVSVIIKNNPGEDPVSAMQTQVTMVESESVATTTVKSLGLPQTLSSFQAAYTASAVTNQIISITLHAPTGAGAVDRANRSRPSTSSSARTCCLPSRPRTWPPRPAGPWAQQQIASLQSQIAGLKGQPGVPGPADQAAEPAEDGDGVGADASSRR